MMYLLDTNTCIHFMRGKYGIREHSERIGSKHILLSEISYAELLYGVENSEYRKHNQIALTIFVQDFQILPITPAIPTYAKERARLESIGQPLDDFDLLIGATAIHHDLTLVTNNTRHFQRLQGIKLEDWTK